MQQAKQKEVKKDNRNRLVAECMNYFFQYYYNFSQKKYLDDYKKRSMILGKQIEVIKGVPTMDARVTITEDERARRREAVNFARGSVRFEGIVLSDEAEALAERFINGEITLEEHTRLGIELARRERAASAKPAALAA